MTSGASSNKTSSPAELGNSGTPQPTSAPIGNASIARASPRPTPSMVDLLDLYRRKYLGIDMVLKTLCYGLRMRMHYAAEDDKARRDFLVTLIDRIIECRMLCNSVKEPGTAKCAIVAFRGVVAAGPRTTTFQRAVALLTTMSFGFRFFEQCFGDLGFTQKVIMQHWDRYYLSNKYKMFKTFSLICCALLELNKLRAPVLKAIAKWSKRREAASRLSRNQKALDSGHIRRLSSCNDLAKDGAVDAADNGSAAAQETASIITSPVAGTPTATPVVRDPTGRGFSPVAAPMGPPEPLSPMLPPPADNQYDLVGLTRLPHVRSALFFIRNIADLIVYSQWIESYRPWKPLEYGCGMVSGGLGVLIVWADTVADATGRSLPAAAAP
jgi:hypothetical protein